MERRLVTNEQEAEQLINALFDMVLDKPSFNNKLMLLDMAEKSKQLPLRRYAQSGNA